ncbi:MAG: DNA methyltransferase [Patescibacteria group bacterium]
MKKSIQWHTEKRKVSDLVPYSKNPRTLSAQQKKDLTKSITKFDLVEIPAINLDNTVIAGHQRLFILRELGRGEELIDVRVPSRLLDQKEFDEYLLRSNRNTGSWNFDLLKEFDTEFLLDIGFDDTDLSSIWDDVLELEDDSFNEEEEIEKALTTDIQSGDLFQLGNHRLLCGDSTDMEAVQKLVGETRVHMVYCDSPYNISLDYNKGIGGKANYGGAVNDSLSDDAFRLFTKQTLGNALGVAQKDTHLFWWCDERYVGMVQSVYEELGIKYQRTCLWIKNGINPTPQIAFSKLYEPCVYGTVGKPYLSDKHTKFAEILNTEVGIGNATLDDVADLIDIWLVKRDASDDYNHPTQKPLTLHERPLMRCTKIGDTVLDLFGGSGSTLLACEQLKRVAYLIEQSPVFCQLIINRWENLTNDTAIKLN